MLQVHVAEAGSQIELRWEAGATQSSLTEAQQQQQQHQQWQQQQQAFRLAQTLPLIPNPASQQTQTAECHSQGAQTDMPLEESHSTQTLTSAIQLLTRQTQCGPGLANFVSQSTQTPCQLQQTESTQTERLQLDSSQQTQAMLLVQATVSTQTEHHAMQQASQHTQTPALLQQHGSTQTDDVISQLTQHTQTPLLRQTPASTQTAVETADAASQCQTLDEQASPAEQRVEAMQSEMAGLQLKVQSLQGIVDIQEQQLKAAAGLSDKDAQQVNWD